MNLCDAIVSSAPTTIMLHSLVEVCFAVTLGDAVLQPLQTKWVSVERGILRGDVVWEQLVGRPLGGDFDIPLPMMHNKRLKLDLGSVARSATATAGPRVRGTVLQVLQTAFESAPATLHGAYNELKEAEALYGQDKFVQARAACEHVIATLQMILDEAPRRDEVLAAQREARSLLSCCAARLGWWDEALSMANSCVNSYAPAINFFRLAVMRFAMQPSNSNAVREPLMRVNSPGLEPLRAQLEHCMRRFAEHTAIDVDGPREHAAAAAAAEQQQPTPAPALSLLGETDAELAAAKTEDDDDDGKQSENKRPREASPPPRSPYY